ncbi:hypothetical protein SEA_FORZA_11 [Gordonia phage Forza]|uniref:Uncharacterized protein n=1 Tax=Gordonia phage Forza TaxID=2571247 RepID=A0A650EY73_9CAUD|nr:hypothetical protein PP303_gp011 [Gordonia phage Forza]QEM41480.1 hypothetical protein SEA_BOOPY_11 [Gordonia phage Boopy]QGT55004.1 hypothetical protein SEA_FORZA_11 [Gordonia phage Forza]UXE04154.1 hypothetical protein SEA_BLUENGOLD_10 [Gordonia phage BlueNGold]WBF03792.1 hypothetical protein SEA_MAREELIH_9 [Gordonia phage Mareelih]
MTENVALPANELTVTVTEDDIREGKKNSPLSCPIALAIRHSGPNVEHACVGREDVSVEWAPPTRASVRPRGEYRMPKEASEFIHRVDNGLAVEPFEFTMTLQPEVDEPVERIVDSILKIEAAKATKATGKGA